MSSSAPPKQTIIRKPLFTALLAQLKPTQSIEIKQIDFAPAQATGLHNHPCPVVGYIAKGTVLFQVEDEEPRTLNAGDAFYIPRGHRPYMLADTELLQLTRKSEHSELVQKFVSAGLFPAG